MELLKVVHAKEIWICALCSVSIGIEHVLVPFVLGRAMLYISSCSLLSVSFMVSEEEGSGGSKFVGGGCGVRAIL